MTFTQYVRRGATAVLAVMLTLWVVDVWVSLALAEHIILGRPVLAARPADYLGLVLAQIPIALGAGLFSFVVAHLVTRVATPRTRGSEATMLCSAVVAACVVLAQSRLVWSPPLRQTLELFSARSFVVAALAGITVWIIQRALIAGRPGEGRGSGRLFGHILYPALIAGLGNQALYQAVHDSWRPASVNAVGALFVFALAASTLYRRKSRWSTIAVWMPVGAALLMAAYSTLASSNYSPAARAAGRARAAGPNIVLIVLDTVRADHIKRFGYRRDTMPNLEAWASNATVFERAVTPAGWTTPAHAAIFSGKPVSLHGAHSAAVKGAFRTRPLEGIDWLPQALGRRGYRCLAVSANRLALAAGRKGFRIAVVPSRHKWHRSTIGSLVDSLVRVRFLQRLSERLRWRMPYVDAAEIVDTVIRVAPDGDQPVFLFVNLMDAHAPYNPPARALEELGVNAEHAFSRYSTHRELTLRWSQLPESRTQSITDLYDGSLRSLDLHLARLLEWIDARYGRNTLIIVTSDHGEELGEEGRVGHEYGLPQRVLHVPLYVRGAGLRPGGRDELVTLRSLYRFILASADGKRPGLDVLTVRDEFGIISERYPSAFNVDDLGMEYGRSWISLLDGGYKAVGPGANGFELFDIESFGFDEERPVPEVPDTLNLRRRIDAYWEAHADRRSRTLRDERLSEQELERLRALGYIK